MPLPNTENFLTWFLDNVRSSQSGCARCACVMMTVGRSAAARRTDLRQHRLLVIGAVGVRFEPTRTDELIERKVSELGGLQVAVFGRLLHPRGVRRPLRRGSYNTVKKIYDPDSRLLDLYARRVQRQ